MPAYQLYVYEDREKREALEQKICEQVDACTEVNGTIRNRIKKFLIEEGITDISEMDAVLRVRYEEYLERNETVLAPITCLRGFDGIVIHRMKEELQTLAGRRNYTTEYQEQWMCLTHYPEIEIAESFLSSKDGKELLWNFTLECPRNLKVQIFTVLKEVIHTYQGCYRKEKLLALQRFYQFCVKHQVADIETMTLDKEQRFEQELSEEFRGKKRSTMFGILQMSRKILFLQAPEIHWQANVWFLERFHFSRERMNPSKPVESVSFKEVTNMENQKILQKYLRYLFGITDLSISTIRIKLLELRTFLAHFNGEEKPIYTAVKGTVLFNGEDITKKGLNYHRKHNISLVFQNYNLIDYLTTVENVKLGGSGNAEKLLEEVGIGKEYWQRNVLQLSGGQQQRVAIARALASDAHVLLADEPTGNLDETTADEIIALLKKTAHELGKCVVVVTHSKHLAEEADEILEIKNGAISFLSE